MHPSSLESFFLQKASDDYTSILYISTQIARILERQIQVNVIA